MKDLNGGVLVKTVVLKLLTAATGSQAFNSGHDINECFYNITNGWVCTSTIHRALC